MQLWITFSMMFLKKEGRVGRPRGGLLQLLRLRSCRNRHTFSGRASHAPYGSSPKQAGCGFMVIPLPVCPRPRHLEAVRRCAGPSKRTHLPVRCFAAVAKQLLIPVDLEPMPDEHWPPLSEYRRVELRVLRSGDDCIIVLVRISASRPSRG